MNNKSNNNDSLKEDIEKIHQILRIYYEKDLKEIKSVSLQEGFALGHKQGIKEGIIKGKEVGYEEGYSIGLKEGIRQKSINIAKNLLNNNISITIISETTGLNIKTIKDIKL